MTPIEKYRQAVRERNEDIYRRWRDNESVDSIGRRHQLANGGVYAVIARGRKKGVQGLDNRKYAKKTGECWKVKASARCDIMLREMGRRGINVKTSFTSPLGAAKLLDVSRLRIYRAIYAGDLAAEKSKGRYRIKMTDLIAWAVT